jgi:hypothetical protein
MLPLDLQNRNKFVEALRYRPVGAISGKPETLLGFPSQYLRP